MRAAIGLATVLLGCLASPPGVARAQQAPALLAQAGALESRDDSTPDATWQAAVRYCQAARYGDVEAQYRLGMLYAFGQGVPADRALAAALFSAAATQGHNEAARMLETIELKADTLPACVTEGVAPERAPPPALMADGPSIDEVVQQLPTHKRWIVPLATHMSHWYALDPRLVLSVIAVESNFEHRALSDKEAQGLMQLIPDTAERFNVRNAFDATQNLRGGMRYLRWLLARYDGNLRYVLAAYNAGEGQVDRYHGVPPFPETVAYVKRVMGLYGRR